MKELAQEAKKQKLVIVIFFFLSGILTASWSSRIPDIQNKLQLSNATLGTVLFAIPVGLVIGLLISSWLVATFGAKRVLLWSCVFTSLCLFLTSTTAKPYQLMIVLFLLGLTRTAYNLSANTAALEVQKHYNRPILAGFHGVWSIACFISGGIGTVMIITNTRPFFHFLGIALAVVSIAVLFIKHLPDAHPAKEKRPFFVMPGKYLFLLGLIAFCAMLTESAMFDWGVNYFQKVVQAKKSLLTAGYMSFIIMMALGRLVGDRFIASIGMYKMLFINGLMMAAGFAIAAIFPKVLPAAFGFLLIGLGESILVPMVYMLAVRTNKMLPSYALSSVTLIGYTGFLVGPLFIGNVSQHFGLSTAFLILAGTGLLTAWLSTRVKKIAVE